MCTFYCAVPERIFLLTISFHRLAKSNAKSNTKATSKEKGNKNKASQDIRDMFNSMPAARKGDKSNDHTPVIDLCM